MVKVVEDKNIESPDDVLMVNEISGVKYTRKFFDHLAIVSDRKLNPIVDVSVVELGKITIDDII